MHAYHSFAKPGSFTGLRHTSADYTPDRQICQTVKKPNGASRRRRRCASVHPNFLDGLSKNLCYLEPEQERRAAEVLRRREISPLVRRRCLTSLPSVRHDTIRWLRTADVRCSAQKSGTHPAPPGAGQAACRTLDRTGAPPHRCSIASHKAVKEKWAAVRERTMLEITWQPTPGVPSAYRIVSNASPASIPGGA